MIRRFLLASAILITAFLGACSKRETPVQEGIRTQTLLIGNLAEPQDLDPHIVTAYTDMNVLVALFEGVTVLDEKTSQALPGVAERWEASADGLVYTFHLRANARWSNGDPVTSHDFAYAFQRILTPAFASEYSYMLWPIKNAEAFNTGKVTDFSAVGVETPDDTTLRITLERPTPYLPSLAAHPTWFPVHRATIEKFGRMDQRSTKWTRAGNLVGNGPFNLTEWTPNSRIVVTKNPLYWDAAATRLNRIIFFPIESADVEERNFRSGQLHLTWDLPVSKIASYRAQTPSPFRNDAMLDILYLNFNLKKPPFDNPLVRRALATGIDREAISRTVFEGVWPAAHSVTPPNCGTYVAPTRSADDFGEARRLLAEAGYPGGKGLPTIPLQVLNDIRQPKLAEALQAMWQRELGVSISIEPYEQKTWLQNQQTMNHTLGVLGWVGDFADPVTFLSLFLTGNGNNWTGWSNSAYDQLLDQASHTADAQARFKIFQQAEALLLHETPMAPLVNRTRAYLISPAVKNWEPAALGIHLYKKVYLQSP
jgi:oligopeptide transport system substrate-binding protein